MGAIGSGRVVCQKGTRVRIINAEINKGEIGTTQNAVTSVASMVEVRLDRGGMLIIPCYCIEPIEVTDA